MGGVLSRRRGLRGGRECNVGSPRPSRACLHARVSGLYTSTLVCTLVRVTCRLHTHCSPPLPSLVLSLPLPPTLHPDPDRAHFCWCMGQKKLSRYFR